MIASCDATGRPSQEIASCRHCCNSRIDAPSPATPGGTSATDVASTTDGFSEPSSKPVRSRSWWYCQPTTSCASAAPPMSSATIDVDVSNTTSYEAPANQTTMSCC